MKKVVIFFIFILSGLPLSAQEVPVPTGLRGEFLATDTTDYVRLTWNAKDENDSITVGYNLLVNYPPNNDLMISGRAGIIYGNTYLYPVNNSKAAVYKFAVRGLTNFPSLKRSEESKIIEVLVPSKKLPFIEIDQFERVNEKIKFTWSYPDDILDLAGFNIYINGQLHSQVPSNDRSIEIQLLEKGKYIFEVSAYSKTNLESPYSQKKLMRID